MDLVKLILHRLRGYSSVPQSRQKIYRFFSFILSFCHQMPTFGVLSFFIFQFPCQYGINYNIIIWIHLLSPNLAYTFIGHQTNEFAWDMNQTHMRLVQRFEIGTFSQSTMEVLFKFPKIVEPFFLSLDFPRVPLNHPHYTFLSILLSSFIPQWSINYRIWHGGPISIRDGLLLSFVICSYIGDSGFSYSQSVR